MKPTVLCGMMLAVALAAAGQTTKPTPTTTPHEQQPRPSSCPGSLTLAATVAPTAATGGMPTGSVQFLNGTNSLGTGTLAVIPSTENFSAPAN